MDRTLLLQGPSSSSIRITSYLSSLFRDIIGLLYFRQLTLSAILDEILHFQGEQESHELLGETDIGY